VRSLKLPELQERRGPSGASLAAVGVVVLALVGFGYWWWTAGTTGPDEPTTATNASPASGTTATLSAKPTPQQPAERPSALQNRLPAPPTSSVPLKPVSSALPGAIALESKGYIIPAHRILVSPKVSGMLTSLNVEEGVRVNKGDVLGTIESIEYEAELRRAKATRDLAAERLKELKAGGRREEIDRAKAELTEAEELQKRMEADLRRAEQLVQTRSVTQAEFDQVSADLRAQRAKVERLQFALKLVELPARQERIAQAEAELGQAEADLVKAQWRLDNCTIRSPISGTILKKNAEEGNIVNAIAFNGSYSICDMADLSDLEVDLNIQERDVAKVFQGQKCRVRAEAYQDRVYEGYVSRLMPIADRAKGAIPVRVKVTVPADEEGVYLKPDMGAIVTFYAREK
jgi:multidrug resistance efflux pump